MAERAPRFENMMDPAGRWLVWDNVRMQPAELTPPALIGLSEVEAASLSTLLNQRHAQEEPLPPVPPPR